MDIKGHWTWFQMIQFPIWPVLQCQCWQTSTKSLLQCCPVPLLPCQPLAGGKTWLWGGRRRKGRSRGGVGGGEARELHRHAGQHMHGWEPGGAQICKGGFNSYSYSLLTFTNQVTHKQKRGSSSTPRLGRKKQEEPRFLWWWWWHKHDKIIRYVSIHYANVKSIVKEGKGLLMTMMVEFDGKVQTRWKQVAVNMGKTWTMKSRCWFRAPGVPTHRH